MDVIPYILHKQNTDIHWRHRCPCLDHFTTRKYKKCNGFSCLAAFCQTSAYLTDRTALVQIQVKSLSSALQCITLNKHHEMQQIYYESSRFDTHSEMKQLHKGLFYY